MLRALRALVLVDVTDGRAKVRGRLMALRDWLYVLGPSHRPAVDLCLTGKDRHEIAAALGLSKMAVSVRLSTAVAEMARVRDGRPPPSRAKPDDPDARMSHAEIARQLGISRQLVQQLEARALAKLRRVPAARELVLAGA